MSKKKKDSSDFIEFIRSQGVAGLAVGFILGGAVSKLVTTLVENIIDPLIGLLVGGVNLDNRTFGVGDAVINWGLVLSTLIDFTIIAAVVFYGFKWLKLDKLDKKKS